MAMMNLYMILTRYYGRSSAESCSLRRGKFNLSRVFAKEVDLHVSEGDFGGVIVTEMFFVHRVTPHGDLLIRRGAEH